VANNIDLKDRIAVVTGGAQGFGKAITERFVQSGAKVAIWDRDTALAEKTAHALGDGVVALACDVGDAASVAAAREKTLERFGRIDILVNNAGIGAANPAEKVTEKDFDETLAVNLKGTFFTAQAVGKAMIRQRAGTIINLSSQAGFVALRTESIYCMTKAAISHLTKCLALEWAPYNITVNAVAPTYIETPGTQPDLDDPAFRASVLDRIPLGRIGDPMDVAAPVVFLASPAAALITGATLLIDGGFTAR